MYIYIYICVHIYIYINIHTDIDIYVYIYRYSELHATHATILSLVIITLSRNGTIQQKGITY